MDVHRTIRILLRVSLLLAILATGFAAGHVQAARADQPRPALAQFTHAGHVLGFGAGGVYLAGLTHALHVQFMGGALNKPDTSASTGAGDDTAQPFERAAYSSVWPGVDIIYTAAPGTIAESTYVVHPGARVGDIRLHYNTQLDLAQDGSLRFSFANGYMTESAPIAWQDVDGKRLPVQVAFKLLGPQEVGFAVGPYAQALPLIIDPAYYWHTFYGSMANDYGYGIALDTSGNIYVVGASFGSWNGPGDETPLHAYVGGADIVVVKLDNGGGYLWHTFYGSNYNDFGSAVTLDSASNIYVLGRSLNGWNGNGGLGPLNPHSGAGNANVVIIKLSTYGGYYWHTFFYGSTQDHDGNVSAGIVVDSNFNIYVVGTSDKAWIGPYDVRPQDINGAEPLNPYAGADDILIIKLNNDGSYAWHTYYGSASYDSGRGITLDGTGKLVVVGDSDAGWTGIGGKAPLRAWTGSRDIMVLKLNSAGAYYWHTFFGSAADDFAYAVVSDDSSNIYLTGDSLATWKGPGGASPRHIFQGGSDIVVLKLSSIGAYKWHGFYGSPAADNGRAIAIDEDGSLYVGGTSASSWGISGKPLPLDPKAAGKDIVALSLNNDGRYLWHAFYGGSGDDTGSGIAVDPNGRTIQLGTSTTSWTGPGSAAPKHAASGGNDMVVVATRAILSTTFRSTGAYDGWVLESGENSNVGGSQNASSTTLRVGDDSLNRQYRSFLHFNTSTLPDSAVVVGAVVSAKVQGVVGVDPMTTHGNLLVDIRSGYYGTSQNLEYADFNATSSKNAISTISTYTISGWKSARMSTSAFPYFSTTGTTQFRMRFALDDNNDSVADYLAFLSGNNVSTSAPLLQVLYYSP